MKLLPIEWRWNKETPITEDTDPHDGYFWDPIAKVEVMPQEVANYIERLHGDIEDLDGHLRDRFS